MLDQKLGPTTLKMGITGECSGTLDKGVICCRWIRVRCGSCIVQGREDSWGATFFDQVADNLVVKIFDRCPIDFFPYVFFLLGFECQFDEDLL